MKREYHEAGQLKHYIFRWHADLIPDGQKYPTEEYFRRAVPSASQGDIEGILSDGDLDVSTPEMERALLAAWDDFNSALCARVLEQRDVTVKRCPKCNRILESPKARLCLWCDYNEYKSENKSVEDTRR